MQPWQIVLIALGGIFALAVLLLLFGRAKIRMSYREAPTVTLSILGIRKRLYPSKEEQESRGLSVTTDPDEILAEEMRRARLARKKLRKAEKKKAKKARKKVVSGSASASDAALNLPENISCIFAAVRELYYATRGKLRFRVHRFRITVSTDDAAKTALLYGVILQSSVYIFQWIETHFNRLRRDPGDMEILPDYTAGSSSAEVDFSCSLSLIRALFIFLSTMGAYESKKLRVLAKRKKKITLGDRITKAIKPSH